MPGILSFVGIFYKLRFFSGSQNRPYRNSLSAGENGANKPFFGGHFGHCGIALSPLLTSKMKIWSEGAVLGIGELIFKF